MSQVCPYCQGKRYLRRDIDNWQRHCEQRNPELAWDKKPEREIVSFLLEKEKAKESLDRFTEELQLHKHGNGIAFLTSVLVANQAACKEQVVSNTEQDLEEEGMYRKLTVIVDRGMAEDVMDIARKAGVGGGTIMHGRGVGAEHTTKLFGIEIEPERNWY